MVDLGSLKSFHNEVPCENAEDMGKCHLSFNSHCSSYVFLEGKCLGIVASFLTLDVKCHFLLKLLALVDFIIYYAEQDRINPQTLLFPSSTSFFICG